MWAIMASPLIISANIRNMSKENVKTYTNREVIAVDQDPMGVQGERIMGGDLSTSGRGVQDGTAITLQSCDASDPAQKWRMGGDGGAMPNGTIYSMALKMAWDSLDCGPDIVAWRWVTNGCRQNQGFSFRPNSEGQLVSTLASTSGAEQCVVANGPATTQLKLAPCNAQADVFSFDRATGLMRRGTKPGPNTLCVGVGPIPSTTNVWARKLSGGKVAMVFINVGSTAQNVTCDVTCIAKTGLVGRRVLVRDLWLHKDIATESKLTELSARNLAAQGGHLMLLLTPTPKPPPPTKYVCIYACCHCSDPSKPSCQAQWCMAVNSCVMNNANGYVPLCISIHDPNHMIMVVVVVMVV